MQQLQERLTYSIANQEWVEDLGKKLQGAVKRGFYSSDMTREVKDLLHGVWLGHPLHAAVTDVPIGAWTTAFLLDRIDSFSGHDMKGAASASVAIGIGGALASAATGLADWTETGGFQRRVGMLHALTNSTALCLFSISLWRRMRGDHSTGKLFGSMGFFTVLMGAYLGGDLVYRLGIQVDRNAWKRGPKQFTGIVSEAELLEDKPLKAEAAGVPIMLVRRGDRVFAINDICAHAGCSLSKGQVVGDTIVCPCHGSTYRLEDGGVVHGPAVYAQPHYETRIQEGEVQVRVVPQ